MKKYLYGLAICIGLLCPSIAGCTVIGKNPATPTVVEVFPRLSVTVSKVPLLAYTATVIPTQPLPPTSTFADMPVQVVLPAVTMSPQEAENALLDLMKTNGNCTGRCIAGIRPDDMTVQDAVDKMSQWGMMSVYENPHGETYINLDQNPLYEQVSVDLYVGTWTRKMRTIDRVGIRIESHPDRYIGENVWMVHRDELQGFRLDNILKAYGIPSYVGYDFSSNFNGPTGPLKKRDFPYGISMHYEQLNLEVFIAAVASYEAQNLSLCPSKNPHYMWMEINPERPMKELEGLYPVTWQAFTGTDLDAFYQVVTNGTNPDACIKTSVKEIQTLHPDYR